jgi:hypothetical protein
VSGPYGFQVLGAKTKGQKALSIAMKKRWAAKKKVTEKKAA